ncbi:hypothetical protein AMECASPLE_029667 [Ameca splendens]|uniref:Uncharacterized protein n=1 Tax=Ameca splendens TaxID=208324 RepID=A0ABV0YU19_9TELE
MTEGTSLQDQARRIEREFKRVKFLQNYFHTLWPLPALHGGGWRLQATYKTGSARLSTEARRDSSAHGFAPDQPPPLPPTPDPVPEGFMDEPPSHSDPVPGTVPEGSQAKPPSYSVLVSEGLVDGLPSLPVPISGAVPEGSQAEPP